MISRDLCRLLLALGGIVAIAARPAHAAKILLATTRPAATPSATSHRYDPAEAYELRTMEGWPVRVNRSLLERHPQLAARALELLRVDVRHQRFLPVRAGGIPTA